MIKLEFDPQWLYILAIYSVGIIIIIIGLAHLDKERSDRKWKDDVLTELKRIKLERLDIKNNDIYNETTNSQEESVVNYWTNWSRKG